MHALGIKPWEWDRLTYGQTLRYARAIDGYRAAAEKQADV